MVQLAELAIKMQQAPSKPAPPLSWAEMNREIVRLRHLSANLARRVRLLAPSEDLEIAAHLKRAHTTSIPGMAEQHQDVANLLTELRDRYPLTEQDRAAARIFQPRDPRVDLLSNALEQLARTFACAAPAEAAAALANFQAMADKAAGHPATRESAAVCRELVHRLQEAQDYAAPVPNECATCEEIAGGFGPTHDGSPRCESGSIASGGQRAHCSCDVCF